MNQIILSGKNLYKVLKDVLQNVNCKKFLLVCDSSFPYLNLGEYFDSLDIPFVIFNDFTPNPLYEDVCKGTKLFSREQCDTVVAIGGGSTIDVAKCIKLYCKMNPMQNYLLQEYTDSGVPLIAFPTTAGTGSESTKYAVIYFEGKKQSVTHNSIVPDYAILESAFLKTLPLYQKKCTMLDALCQGIESWWSVNSTDESKKYSKLAVGMIINYMDSYINNNSSEAAEHIMLAANYAGRAINITQTTAAHAMSYKITSIYGLPHGHAVSVCLPHIWEYMINHTEQCIDSRGIDYLVETFSEIAGGMGCSSVPDAIEKFKNILCCLDMQYPKSSDKETELKILTSSVNPVRLKNNPIALNENTLYEIYSLILK